MLAEQLLKAGDLSETVKALQADARRAPAELKFRVFLFQVLVLQGQWERALKQLQVAATVDAEATSLAAAYRELIRCEVLRADVFHGRRAPVLMGDPAPWMAMMVQALALTAEGRHEAAEELREEALEAAPVSPGVLNGEPFAWIADSDSRIGPMLEVIVRGRYCWLPFARVQSLVIDAPVDLRDLVWTPAKLGLDGMEAIDCFIPTRYPGTELASDALRLSRKTEWSAHGRATACGLGQRMFVTDTSELGLLDVRRVDFSAPLQPSMPAASEAGPMSPVHDG